MASHGHNGTIPPKTPRGRPLILAQECPQNVPINGIDGLELRNITFSFFSFVTLVSMSPSDSCDTLLKPQNELSRPAGAGRPPGRPAQRKQMKINAKVTARKAVR